MLLLIRHGNRLFPNSGFMIPLSEKKVKRSSGKSNTICENRRKNKSLVKYVLRKTPKACRCAPFLCPKRVQNAFTVCPPCAAAQRSLVYSPRVSSRSSAQNACLCTRTCRGDILQTPPHRAHISKVSPRYCPLRQAPGCIPGGTLLRYARMRIFYRLFTPITSRK